MFFNVFSISISLPNELETRMNINRGFLMKNSQCEEPSFDHVDVSQGLNDAYEDKVIYSCQGSFDKTLLTRRSHLLIYSSQFKIFRPLILEQLYITFLKYKVYKILMKIY